MIIKEANIPIRDFDKNNTITINTVPLAHIKRHFGFPSYK